MKIDNNKKLPVVIESNMTCYEAVDTYSTKCQKQNCKNWINFEKGRNCLLVTTRNGPLTLSEVGKIYGLTRMRICQIEKNIYQKLKSFILE